MAYDRQSLLISWLFDIIGEDEVAITSLHVSGSTTFDAVDALGGLSTGDLDALQVLMSTLMSDSNLLWADFSRATGIKVAALDVTGHYLTDPLVRDIQTPASGSSNGPIYPQDSIVISLRAASTFGQANRGRMYLPHCATIRVSATPFMSGTQLGGLRTAAQTFLNGVNDVTNTGADPAVLQIMSSKGTGTSKGVATLAVGNVLDTQRRRRNRLTENYLTATVSL